VPRPNASLLVTDLDNTLFDWFAIWYGSFDPMLQEILRISGVPKEKLLEEIRVVHQRRGTSEYSGLLLELPSLTKLHPGEDLGEVYASAIAAFREGRKNTMRLYPRVMDTLTAVKKAGIQIIGYTESRAFYSALRLRWFELDGVIDVLYSPADHEFPAGITRDDLRKRPPETYELQKTEARHTPKGHLKPDIEILATIVEESGCNRSEVVYVGDSLIKDVAMAKDLGVSDVWAEYGVSQDKDGYDLLRSVSHWTQADVDREREIGRRPDVAPSYVLSESFGQLLDLFDFTAPNA